MKHFSLTLLAFVMLSSAFGQYTVRLVVNEVAAKKDDDIYVAGSFNEWRPRDEKYKLKPFGVSRRALILKDVAPGKYEFKFTRGSFDKVETTAKGEEVPNHQIVVQEDVAQNFNIPGWKDDYPDKPKPHTATAQVKVIDTAFAIPQLNRTRRIWAYVPKSYATGTRRYPVIYMQDGQNLFSEHTAFAGEWGIDETIDTLMRASGKEAIIIGIDNGGDKRMNEYNPYDFKNGKGEGNEYVDFLALTLKPFIDKKFRTLKDSAHTYIAGSSMGALISVYAVAKYPRVFSGAGIFSPAFQTAPDIYDYVDRAGFGRGMKRFYFYAGGKESDTMIPDMDKMIAIIEKKGNYETNRLINPLGKHNEAAWRKEFANFYRFIVR